MEVPSDPDQFSHHPTMEKDSPRPTTMPSTNEKDDLKLNLLEKEVTQLLSKQKGGLRTIPFIIANEAFEKVASYGLTPNMISYLMNGYRLDLPTGTLIISLWSATTYISPIVGALIADSYLGRYHTIVFGSFISLSGMILLWLTTMIPRAKPPICNFSPKFCKSASPLQLIILYSSFVLMSVGAGGIRACSLAFGADQLDRKENPQNGRVLQSFISWYSAATAGSVVVAFSIIVYVQDHYGWKVGFGVPAIFMFLSAIFFLLASQFYVKRKASKSLLVGLAQVIVVAYKNKNIVHPPANSSACYHHGEGLTIVAPTEKLRFLNKACIMSNPNRHLNDDGLTINPWSLCTVEQVEELKSLIKVIPICFTSIILQVGAGSFGLLQANSLDRHITSNFEIPAGSFSMFTLVTFVITTLIYDRLRPLLVKLTGKPYGIGVKARMGIGLVISSMSVVVTAIVEGVRRKIAIKQGFIDNPSGVLNMSAMWLLPQLCLTGIGEALNQVAQTEFYYNEFPKSMSSIAVNVSNVAMALGNLITGLLVNIVDDVTKKGGKESWVSGNINRAHYDYFYWFITILNCINFLYFLVCCWSYGPCEGEQDEVKDMGDCTKEEEFS